MSLAIAAAFGLAALGPAIALRGFTVDDALITARYASNIAAGEGYRLSAGGPVTDGVTPLGFAYLLAPFAGGGPLAALSAAKWLGALAWTLGSVVLGLAASRVIGSKTSQNTANDRLGAAAILIPIALLATSAPLGAWAASGMETGFVAALGALAVALPLLERPLAGALCAGLAAGLRPELLPWAATLGMGLFSRRSWKSLAAAITPFALVSVVRLAAFGRPAPLSIFAKAPDARLGVMYALACAILAGPPALLAPRAILRLPSFERAVVASVFVHLLAIGLAGGDWMPLSRLMVPVLPSIALGALLLAREASLVATSIRTTLAVAGHTFVLVHIGPTAARVGADRMRVIEELRPALADARVVASLDIGWVGAATPAAIVDLAGVTDPRIAALPGGHTTKQIPAGLLDARGADTLVLLLAPDATLADPWTRSRFARGVEAWIATTPGMQDSFAPIAQSSLPHLRYVILRRAHAP